MELPVAEPTPTQPPRPWRSPRDLANWTIALILVHIVVVLLNIALNLSTIDQSQHIQTGEQVNRSQAFSKETTELTILSLDLITYYSVVISFLMWVNRASKNLASIGVENQIFGPLAAVVWWFVPIASLWMPYRVVAEIWTGSHPQKHPPPPILILWWLAWVISNFVAAMVWTIPSDSTDTTINQLILQRRFELVSDMISIPDAVLLIWLIWRITHGQVQKHATRA